MHTQSRFWLVALLLLCVGVTNCGSDPVEGSAEQKLKQVDCVAPVELPSVTLRGTRDGTSCAYKGIPYAQSPVGELRFRPPLPLKGHQGIVKAYGFGKDCIQSPTFAEPGVDEDCLFLNVWTRGETEDGKLNSKVPVMVFFFGGGFTVGAGSWPLYNGESLTTHGVMVVTINYRVGPLGYLAPGNVTDTNGTQLDGNLGLRDQAAALRWVQANIAGLGGDVGRVTIFGESAGAWSVCDAMASTETEGLFHRAIMQSGECYVGNRAEIAVKADAWIASTGCPVTGATSLDCLRALDLTELPKKYPYSMGGGMYPNVDGKLLTDQPLLRLRAGAASRIPLIAGYNREETDALRLLPDHVQRVKGSFPEFWAKAEQAMSARDIKRARAVYGDDAYSDPMALATAMLDDIVFTCPSLDAVAAQVSQGAPAWHYRFSPGSGENAIEPYLGSFHGLEIPFVFGNTGGLVFVYNDSEAWARMHDLTDRIQRYWTRFAATGDPNGGDDPEWPGFGEEHNRLELNVDPTVTQGESDARCAFWGSVAPMGLGERFAFVKKMIGFNPIE